MQSPFTLLLPLPEGCRAEALPGLVALLDHASAKGRPMAVQGLCTLFGVGGVRMAQLTLVEVQAAPVFIVESLTALKSRGFA
ncbi:MAG TPA: hypothetical protein VD948_01595 [Rhodothermales bacterium]|nr:hypothetical protein [Rhodothermales bacterium]